jgi:hypothetical protein
MIKRIAWLIIAAALCTPALWAQSTDTGTAGSGAAGGGGGAAGSEDEFFGSSQVEVPQGTAEKPNVQQEIEKERVGLSGVLQGTGTYNMTRNFINGTTGLSDNTLADMFQGDFLVDIRLQKSFRAFIDLNLGYVTGGAPVGHTYILTQPFGTFIPGTPLYVSENQTTLLGVKEIFVDFNIANTVYFRAGKQVLQWGTGYFWNPTDLINIEHKSFTNQTALLQGVFGLRSDVVFSPKVHLYTFLNLDGIQDISDTAFAARTEFLVGTFEFGFSGWVKPYKLPVVGTDFTTPLFWNLNLTGEAAFSWGDNQDKLDPTTVTAYSVRNQVVPKVDIGLSRTFDVFDVQDRLNVMAEFFYNGDGYDQNMFQLLKGNSANLATFLGGYYHAGYYGQYYGALFITYNSFFLTNLTLTLDALANFSDGSAIPMVMLSYAPVNNFTLTFQIGGYIGADNREYTVAYNPTTGLTNNALFVILGATVNF